MLFSSITFLYYFLPITVILYFAAPNLRLKNCVLLLASLLFYFWGEPKYLPLLIFTALSGYLHGLVIERWRGSKKARAATVCSVVVGVAILVVFKYSDFAIASVNALSGADIPLLNLALPIGVSFYTFQTLSYTIDLYRGRAEVQRNFFDFATYVAMFPQLIAGPIVRYTDVARELTGRRTTLAGAAYGVRRFCIGLAKKVLIANSLGELCSIYSSSPADALFTWLYAISFAFQIYYDFSGYSDMAIGLGALFGFKFPENFNYPYISRSVTDFWRRWHMTLSSWFRDYLYIPLGGNRVKLPRHIFNLAVVWALTGLWHGAAWNFALWGLYFAVLLIAEKLFLSKLLSKLPRFIGFIYTALAVLISWMIFDSGSAAAACEKIALLFGAAGAASELSLYYLRSYAVLLAAAAVGSTPFLKLAAGKIASTGKGAAAINAATPVFAALCLVVSTAYLIDGSFNPFLYFRF